MAGDDPKSSALEGDEDEDPYIDPFDGFGRFTDEDLQNVMADPNPNLMDMSFTEYTPPSVFFHTSDMETNESQLLDEIDLSIINYDTNDDFDVLSFIDDGFNISWDMFEPSNDELNENINNDVPGETRNDNGDDGVLVCSCCQKLRELVHIKEGEMYTLDIFGGIGFFCHAILSIQRSAPGYVEPPQTFHLKDLTIEEVKKFIEDYCFQRVASGLSLAQDTNAAFYEAVSANSIFNQSPPMLALPTCSDVSMSLVSPDETFDVPPVPLDVGLRENPTTGVRMHVGLRKKPTTGVRKERERRKTALAAQRERTKNMTLKDICMYFHLPIETAAKRMKLCPTVLKKICRNGGLMRWPHRKIKSLEKKIASLKRVLPTAKNGEEKACAVAKIAKLERAIYSICSDALKNMK